MSKIYRRALMVFVFVVAFVFLWSEIDTGRLNEKQYSLPDKPLMNLSVLPDELSKSLQLINKKAGIYKNAINKSGFTFNNFNLAGERYISKNTPLILQTYYQKSSSLKQDIVKMPANFVGLTLNELKGIIEEWEIKEYSPGEVMVLYRSLQQISPEDKNKMHLGVREGKVAIFYGEKGEDNLKKITDIDVDKLPLKEQENLRQGIIIRSNEELLSILDSLISSISRD